MPGRRFSDAEEIKIVALYHSGMSAKAIARRYRLPGKDSIIGALRRAEEPIRPNAIANRLYHLKEDAFDELTPEACYWWGFVYADGNLNRERSLTVTLQLRDRKHLISLAKFLGSDRPIKDIKVQKYDATVLSVTSQHMGRRLIELGIIAHRPHPETIDRLLPINLARHWLRGFFDGDGSIGFRRTSGQPRITFCGSLKLIRWIRSALSEGCHSKVDATIYQHKSGLSYLEFSGRKVVARVMDYLYAEPGPCLLRKRERYETGRP